MHKMSQMHMHLRQTLVICEIGHHGKSSISIFYNFFAGIKKSSF